MPSVFEELPGKAWRQIKRFGRYCLNQYRKWYAKQQEKQFLIEREKWIEQVKQQISSKVYYILGGDSELYAFVEVPEYEQQETVVNGQSQLQTVQIGIKKVPFVYHLCNNEPYCEVFSVRILGNINEEQKEILTDFIKTLRGPQEKWVWVQKCKDGKYIRFCMANNENDKALSTAIMQKTII